MNNITIRIETPSDYREVEELTREAFWDVNEPGCCEHYLVHCMRRHGDFVPELALVAELGGRLVGSIMFLRCRLLRQDGSTKDVLSFGPLCVLPSFQRRGIGRLLLEQGLQRARSMGAEAVVIFGDPGNYVARGFKSCRRFGVSLGGVFPAGMLVKELQSGALAGGGWEFLPSAALDCCQDAPAVEAFDALFPKKEKGWRPSQEQFYITSHSLVQS